MTTDDLDLVACVSHDLKSPLNAILGFTSLIQDQLTDGPSTIREIHRSLETIQGIGQDMLALINNMLVTARVHSSQEALTPTTIRREELYLRAEGLAHTFLNEAHSRKIDFTVLVHALPERVHWDITKLRYFAINNIISNALKFVGEGGTVRVEIDTLPDDLVEITVSDNGPGIPQEERGIIFEKYVQSSNNVRSHQGGGFGLYNAAAIVGMHGGRIEVLDGLDGRGVTFRLILPALPSKSAPPSMATIAALPN